MKINLTTITAEVTAAEVYGKDEIEVPKGKQIVRFGFTIAGDQIIGTETLRAVICTIPAKSPRLIIRDVPMRRTITFQATGIKRRLARDEAGLDSRGKLIAFGISTADEYEPLRLISDREEPER